MPWASGADHIRHIRDLETMLRSSALREYSAGSEPPGFREKWDPYFRELFLVAALMYLEGVFGTDSHWQQSGTKTRHPNLYKRLEAARCLRNCIVHNAGVVNPAKLQCEHILRNFDAEVRMGAISEEFGKNAGKPVEPFYTIGSSGRLTIGDTHHVRWLAVAYLMATGQAVSV